MGSLEQTKRHAKYPSNGVSGLGQLIVEGRGGDGVLLG